MKDKRTYIVGDTEFLDPREYPPPEGRKMILLTEGHTATIGHWHGGHGVIGWYPLPAIPQSLKDAR